MIYILILPVLEELATVIVQALEILKGKAMVTAQKVQNELIDLSKTEQEVEPTHTQVIGFQLPIEEEYEDEEDQDEDE